MTNKVYGSGYFGEWIEDAFGLPAYRYTCDQTCDPKATGPVYPEWRNPTEHLHQVGNDRLVAVASNYGYVQVRQDEGSPKFLNDFDPENHQYAGGFGYLSDGQTMLSTFYPGQGESFDRVFGMGYLRKTVAGNGCGIDQVLFAPFGDDPLLISQVTITNHRDTAADFRWIEYWGNQLFQFSYRATMLAFLKRKLRTIPGLRRELSLRFGHRYSIVDNSAGLVGAYHFLGRSLRDRMRWWMLQSLLATVGRSFFGGPVKLPVPESYLEDLAPPPVFLVSLNAPADGWSTNARAFFGEGGTRSPTCVHDPLAGCSLRVGPEGCMLLERRFQLAPEESRTLYFAYGYLPEGQVLETLLAKYRDDFPQLWARSSEAWKTDRIALSVPDASWVDRELTWHNYYLRSNQTYDTFFREHILSQGHAYQYLIGFQGAARDPLQHALPFIFSQPEIVKQVLRYTLKEVQSDGEVPFGIVGHGMLMPAPFCPSDQEMWLLWLASEYVLATRDKAFLDEQIPTYPLYGPEACRARVRELLARCYSHLTEVTGTGQHGLLRLSNGDWNDGAVIGNVPKKQHKEVRQSAESVLNAAMAAYVLDLYGRMLQYVGDLDSAKDALQWAEVQRAAVQAQWVGRWFRRAWLTPELGWIGEDQLWLEPQPWAIIGRATTLEQQGQLVQAINEGVRQPSAIGAMLHSKGVSSMEYRKGVLTNGGVWPSINGTLVWALAQVNGEMAWDEWKKNTLAQHAETYPEVWYGIWSGPDSFNSALSAYPGRTMFNETLLDSEATEPPAGSFEQGVNWTDFPVMNMHPHSWSLYSITKLLGIVFTPDGVELRPSLPERVYRFASPLLGLERSPEGYSGWYAPLVPGTWRFTLFLPMKEKGRHTRLEVNGATVSLKRLDDDAIQWTGESVPGKPLYWDLG